MRAIEEDVTIKAKICEADLRKAEPSLIAANEGKLKSYVIMRRFLIFNFQLPQSTEYIEQEQLNRAEIIWYSSQSRYTRLCSCFSIIRRQSENP